ncbi:MAG TPA: DUF4180 domain-containing protein [Longilinea sp.]|nr:DUF4180 domain-containing protein [Longilinea sp.]
MDYRLVEQNDIRIIECLQGFCIKTEKDALDVVGFCGESQSNRVLLYECNLGPDFYDLKTGLAGMMLLKFSNYRIVAAAVLDPLESKKGRFGEFAWETNHSNEFRIFPDRTSALNWLAGKNGTR